MSIESLIISIWSNYKPLFINHHIDFYED